MIHQKATGDDIPAIIELLKENKLPVEDIAPGQQLFWMAKAGDTVAAVIGLEQYGAYGLLRSMATRSSFQNKGMATALVNELFQYAKGAGLKEIYLLTETAEKYFEKKGFRMVRRDEVPEPLKASKEFSHLCPSSAVVMKKTVAKKKVLFVCVENSNRSQMSQAFATMLGGDAVEAYSAGSKPSGIVNPKAIAAMKELGYDLSGHDSKSLDEVKQYAPFDAVVTMGCGDACPWMPAKKFIDWEIPDPKNMGPEEFNKVRDLIKEKINWLLVGL
ncbi:MAG: arsenic resistance N-acetyltransferase ArsN2 [Bacteroidota bacterium]